MRKIGILIFLNILVLFSGVFILEGLLSWSQFVMTFRQYYKVAEERHTEYDSLLGWVNKPDLFVQNMYGADRHLTILPNRTRLTNAKLDTEKPSAICLGDSFTFGYGVNDDDTWCSLLSSQYNTINMGQGGYGLDQSFLWYWRDGAQFNHDLVISAFITEDFRRMQFDTFVGYPKPLLKTNGSALTLSEYPLPQPKQTSRLSSILHRSLYESELRTYDLFQKIKNLSNNHQSSFENNNNFEEVFEVTVGSLSRKIISNGATPVFILLPTFHDKENPETYLLYRDTLTELSKKYGFTFISFEGEIAEIENYKDYFILPGEIPYSDSAWHYNEAGNVLLSDLILEKLQ